MHLWALSSTLVPLESIASLSPSERNERSLKRNAAHAVNWQRVRANQEPMPEIRVSLIWVGLDETPLLFANCFMSQYHQDGFFLSIGQFSPPPILGSPAEVAEQIKQLGPIPIRPIARMSLTPDRMRELLKIIQENLQNYEKQKGTP